MTYSEQIWEIAKRIPKTILDVTQPRVRGRRPTQQVSEFLSNKEQGDWAEDIVRITLSECLIDHNVVKYGKTDDIMAGDDGFEDFYNHYQDELDKIGKRPDLLILEKGITQKNDISSEDYDAHEQLVPNALMGWEVRSSTYLVNKYKPSESATRKFLSFTVKFEDVLIVLKWIEKYNVPHYYTQVFFDSIYIISFKKILEIISNPNNLKKIFFIEKNRRNQMKTTFHIDINEGDLLGKINELPEHYSARKNLERGRLLHYITYKKGNLVVDTNILKKIIEEANAFH